jgi:hypothetical protein
MIRVPGMRNITESTRGQLFMQHLKDADSMTKWQVTIAM